jgi:hypothetical protein
VVWGALTSLVVPSLKAAICRETPGTQTGSQGHRRQGWPATANRRPASSVRCRKWNKKAGRALKFAGNSQRSESDNAKPWASLD